MAPGFLPRAYAICTIVLGALIFAAAMRRKTQERSSIDYRFFRSFLGIMAAIVAFAIVIPKFGLIPGCATYLTSPRTMINPQAR